MIRRADVDEAIPLIEASLNDALTDRT
jgi:hypothetical protein